MDTCEDADLKLFLTFEILRLDLDSDTHQQQTKTSLWYLSNTKVLHKFHYLYC